MINNDVRFFIIGSFWLGVLLFFSPRTVAQNSWSFLKIANNAQVNGLGGVNVSLVNEHNINLFTSNPALLDSAHNGQIGLNFSPYLALSNLITLNYSPKFTESPWAISLQNLNYGVFQGTDIFGNLTNQFSANDFSLGLTHARKINYISIGITAKIATSVMESYNSVVFLTDWGGSFKHPKHDFSIGLVVKNIGFVLKKYGNTHSDIPSDLQIGVSFKPQYMPVRFSFTGYNLYIFDNTYDNPVMNYTFDGQGNKIPKRITTVDKIFRHFIFGGEILAHKHFSLLLGYNFLRRKELLIEGLNAAVGFSFGANLHLKRLDFTFSHALLVSPKGQTCFTLCWRR